jgi:hypothetical protein
MPVNLVATVRIVFPTPGSHLPRRRVDRLQHRPLGKTNKPVNHAFGSGGITEKALEETPLGRLLWLDQAAPDRVANQTGGFMNI